MSSLMGRSADHTRVMRTGMASAIQVLAAPTAEAIVTCSIPPTLSTSMKKMPTVVGPSASSLSFVDGFYLPATGM